ncbi:phosphopantetheine-binding protein [Spirillospora sp. CA-253888]
MPQKSADTLRARVTDIISNQFEVPREQINPGVTLAELDLDSLALVELAAALEEEFDIPSIEEDVTMDDTFDKVLKVLRAKGATA